MGDSDSFKNFSFGARIIRVFENIAFLLCVYRTASFVGGFEEIIIKKEMKEKKLFKNLTKILE